MATKTLSCTIKVNDNFTSSLNKFSQSIQKSEQAFNKFANSLDKATGKIVSNINSINTKLTAMQQKTNSVASNISNSSLKQANSMQQNQERVISNIEQRYQQMEQKIVQNLNNINNGSRNTLNSLNGGNNGGNNRPTNPNESSGNDNVLGSLLSGNFGSIIGKLGLIGSGIIGVTALVKTINSSMDIGFDILNKASGNLFSYDGLQEGMQDAMGYETGRKSLDLFYGDKGKEEYEVATKVAQGSFAKETDTISIMSRIGQTGTTVSKEQLKDLVDVAGTRPSVSTEHIGLAVQEALDGRTAMLKMYGITNAKLQAYYKDLQKTNPSKYKDFKGALNKNGGAGDSQKYFNLLTSYIEQSPMAGYADKYMETVQGKLAKLGNLIQNAKSQIMGMDVKEGTPIKGSAYDAFGKAVDALEEKLSNPNIQSKLEKVGNSFGSVFTVVGEAFGKLLENTDWDKVAKSIKDTGQIVADWLNDLVKTGALEKLADNLPTIVSSLLKWKVAEETVSHPVATAVAENAKVTDPSTASGQFWNSKFGQFFQTTGPGMYIKGQQIIGQYAHDLIDLWRGGDSSESVETDNSIAVSDNDLISKIGLSNLSKDQIASLTDMIKNDGVDQYKGINIENMVVNANNFDEIWSKIKQASSNKK